MAKAKDTNIVALRRRLDHLDRDRGYRWKDQDPVLQLMNRVVTDSGWSLMTIQDKSGVAAGTIRNWQLGKVSRPQNWTVEQVLKALGYSRKIYGPDGKIYDAER